MSSQSIHYLYTAITRFGTILFVIYMVSVLLSVFRYVMRLAAYYEARSHATMIAMQTGELDSENLPKYIASFDGEKVEFGKDPTTPLENGVEMIKAVGEVVKKAKE